jgi:hypothetical protein
VSKKVLAMIKFVNGPEEFEIFGHVNYDLRVQMLWVGNNRRDSLIVFKITFDSSPSTSEPGAVRGAYFKPVVKFCGPTPTIHFEVILSADPDRTVEEAMLLAWHPQFLRVNCPWSHFLFTLRVLTRSAFTKSGSSLPLLLPLLSIQPIYSLMLKTSRGKYSFRQD